MNEYESRNAILKRLGYDSYQTYLRSDRWKIIRAKFLRKAQVCCVCRTTATQVHHIKYTEKGLLGKSDKWLIAVCNDCHTYAERDEFGNKTSWMEAQKRFLEMIRKYNTKGSRKKLRASRGARSHTTHGVKRQRVIAKPGGRSQGESTATPEKERIRRWP